MHTSTQPPQSLLEESVGISFTKLPSLHYYMHENLLFPMITSSILQYIYQISIDHEGQVERLLGPTQS